MAQLSAYATLAEYRDRVSDKSAGTDAVLTAQLLSCSRLLERSLRVSPGAFNSHTAVYRFDAIGGDVLTLRDRSGRAYFLQTVGTDKIDIEGELFDLSDSTVLRGLNENAAAGGEPYTALQLMAGTWPIAAGAVTIDATWGWATVPGIIVELTVHVVHDLRDAHLGGATLEMPSIDGTMPLRNDTKRMWRDAKRAYDRRRWMVA